MLARPDLHKPEARQGEARFQAIAERLYDAIILVGANTRVIYASPSTSRILGLSIEEYVGASVFERMHPDDVAEVVDGFTKILGTPGAVLEIRCRYQHQDGSWRWLEGTARNWLHDRGVRAIVGAFRDVTERYLAEKQLKQAYEVLELSVTERTDELSAANESLKEHISERKHFEKLLRERNRELKILNTITNAISRSLDLDVILATLQRLLTDELEIAAGCIYVFDPEEEAFSLRLHWGLPETAVQLVALLPVERLSKTPPANEDESADHSYATDTASIEGLNRLHVLLPVKGQTYGVLDLYRHAPADFTREQERFFNILGQQVAVALANAQLFGEVIASREQMQGLSRRLVEVQEIERRKIASELHDEVGQLLTGLKMNLELAKGMPPDGVQEPLDEALVRVNELLTEVRSLSLDLRPPMLDDLGLLPALLWSIRRFEVQTGIQIEFKHSGLADRYATEYETAVYRIVQEALTNIARHAGEKRAAVRLWATRSMLGVQIEDAGKGFIPQAVLSSGNSVGLAGMRERTALLGGSIAIESVVLGGTCITAEFPLERGTQRTGRMDYENGSDRR